MKRLYVVGLGPGGTDYLTPQARKALEDCEVLCGYTTYTKKQFCLAIGTKK